LGLAVRLLFAAFRQWIPDDAIGYDTLARNVLAGNGFSLKAQPPYELTLFRTPVYPYFLSALYALFGFHDIVVYAAQAVIGAATCCLMYFVARRYLSQQAALLTAAINAVYPLTSHFVAAKLTEILYTFLICCAIYLIIRGYQKVSWRWMCAAGGTLGVASLCRPEAMLFPIFLAGLFLLLHRFKRPWWKMSMALVVFAVLVTVPWLVRNYNVREKPTGLVGFGPGLIFWQGTIPYFDWYTFEYAPGSEQYDPIVKQLLRTPPMTEVELSDLDPKLLRVGMENIRRNPKSYFVRRLKGYPHLWISGGDYLLGDYNRSFGQALSERRYFLIAMKLTLLAGVGLLPLVLATIGLFINRRRLVELLPLWAFPLYVTITRLPLDAEPRNTMPAHPYMLVFAVCGALYWWGLYTRRRKNENRGKSAEAIIELPAE
jgi:4-amino-4-deoxy-L-arabinose transferase-like glycosyltransferase